MNRNQKSPVLGAILAILVLMLASCGDSGDAVATAPTNQVQTQFTGTNSFNNGQTGTLDFTVLGNGFASGTYQVTNDVNPQTINVSTGTFDVNGTASLASGVFSLSGTFPVLGEFTITGTLPEGSNQTTYVLSVSGQTFQGTLQAAGTTNGGNSGEGRIIQGGTVNNLTFQFSPDFNGDQPPVNQQSNIAGSFGPGAGGEQTLTITLSETVVNGNSADTNLLTVSIVDPSGGDLVLNQPYPVVVNANDAGSLATLSKIIGVTTTADSNWVSVGQTSSGTATITALSDTEVTLEFNFDNLVPNPELSGNQAVGSFDLIGSITGTFATTP